jgi:hypothetical protein
MTPGAAEGTKPSFLPITLTAVIFINAATAFTDRLWCSVVDRCETFDTDFDLNSNATGSNRNRFATIDSGRDRRAVMAFALGSKFFEPQSPLLVDLVEAGKPLARFVVVTSIVSAIVTSGVKLRMFDRNVGSHRARPG